MFINWLRIFSREEILQTHAPEIKKKKVTDASTYAADIMVLKEKFGNVKEIEISLQELLKLCPRSRARTDAYKGLVAELKKEGIELKITSRKKNKREA